MLLMPYLVDSQFICDRLCNSFDLVCGFDKPHILFPVQVLLNIVTHNSMFFA